MELSISFFLRPGEPAVGASSRVHPFEPSLQGLQTFLRYKRREAVRRILRKVGRKASESSGRNKRVLPHNERIFRLTMKNFVVRAQAGQWRKSSRSCRRRISEPATRRVKRRVFPDVFSWQKSSSIPVTRKKFIVGARRNARASISSAWSA